MRRAQSRRALVKVFAGPAHKPLIDRSVEAGEQLGDAAGRGDDDDHHHLGLQSQHLYVADRGSVERRR